MGVPELIFLNVGYRCCLIGIGAGDIFVSWALKQAQLEGPAVNRISRLDYTGLGTGGAAMLMLPLRMLPRHECNQHCCRSKNFRGLYGHTCNGELHFSDRGFRRLSLFIQSYGRTRDNRAALPWCMSFALVFPGKDYRAIAGAT